MSLNCSVLHCVTVCCGHVGELPAIFLTTCTHNNALHFNDVNNMWLDWYSTTFNDIRDMSLNFNDVSLNCNVSHCAALYYGVLRCVAVCRSDVRELSAIYLTTYTHAQNGY